MFLCSLSEAGNISEKIKLTTTLRVVYWFRAFCIVKIKIDKYINFFQVQGTN